MFGRLQKLSILPFNFCCSSTILLSYEHSFQSNIRDFHNTSIVILNLKLWASGSNLLFTKNFVIRCHTGKRWMWQYLLSSSYKELSVRLCEFPFQHGGDGTQTAPSFNSFGHILNKHLGKDSMSSDVVLIESGVLIDWSKLSEELMALRWVGKTFYSWSQLCQLQQYNKRPLNRTYHVLKFGKRQICVFQTLFFAPKSLRKSNFSCARFVRLFSENSLRQIDCSCRERTYFRKHKTAILYVCAHSIIAFDYPLSASQPLTVSMPHNYTQNAA